MQVLKKPPLWNYLYRRNLLSKEILDIKSKIGDICTVEAPLALLKVEVGTAQGVEEIFKVLARLPVDFETIVERIRKDVDQGLHEGFRKLGDQIATLDLPSRGQTSGSQQTDRKDEIRKVEGNSFGIERPFEKLQDLLLDEGKNTKWVGICGTGGLGKTRLATLAYNTKDVQARFDKRIWLTVGNEKSIEELRQNLRKELCVERDNIFHELRDKKVLLVLDDVWDKGDPVLEQLDVTGPDTGSKILVTTGNIKILEKAGAQDQSIVKMEPLSRDDSWQLFQEFAFKGIVKISTVTKELAQKVAAECKGLPLALKIVAGALATKKSKQEWTKALKSLQKAEILESSHEKQLYKRLKLSYDDLESVEIDHPHYLQKCFVYFASFPEDTNVDSEKLVKLWAGEKLLQAGNDTDDDSDLLQEGYILLWELIGRSLIELREGEWSEDVNSRQLTCRVHDVLRDFARHLISEKRAPMDCLFSPGKELKKFPDEWFESPSHPSNLISEVSHLSLNGNQLESLPDKFNAPKLEVLLLANNMWKHPLIIPPGFLESFSSLKVLDLEGTRIESLPETLGNLTSLVYLELSRTKLRTLPQGLRELTRLEYLSLSGCDEVEPWPFGIECLKSLSTLNTRKCKNIWQPLTTEPGLDSLHRMCSLLNLQNLSIEGNEEYLPSEMSQLVNLRHLSVSFGRLKRLPPELHSSTGPQLSKLHYLSLSGCNDLCELPSWLDSLPHLAILDLSGCRELWSLPPQFAREGAFPALKILRLEDCVALKEFPCNKVGAFPKLESLYLLKCKNLQQLGDGFGSKGVFPSLKILRLEDCVALKEFPCTKVGAFPKLESFYLLGCKNLQRLGNGFGSKGVFPFLKILSLEYCVALKEFPCIEVGAFPKLDFLYFAGCKNLQRLGDGFGSNEVFPSLEILRLKDCVALKEFPCIEVGAFPKLESFFFHRCENLQRLGNGFGSKGVFPSLKILSLEDCVALKEFPCIEVGAFPKLKSLFFTHCKNLQQLGDGFGSKGVFPYLEILSLEYCVALKEFPCIEVGAFPKLKSLFFTHCKNLQRLGDGFGSKGVFPYLEIFNLEDCVALKEFPCIEVGAYPKLEACDLASCKTFQLLGNAFGSKRVFRSLEGNT